MRCGKDLLSFFWHVYRQVSYTEFSMLNLLVVAPIKGWFKYLETVRELSSLTDRQLYDLGIYRFDIRSVARQKVGV